MPSTFYVYSSMGTEVFWQFIFKAIVAAIVAIHGHMTPKMGVATKDHVYLFINLKDIDRGISREI